jgi:1-acyl-sn-glycerol-3-phosphate acyltransferase
LPRATVLEVVIIALVRLVAGAVGRSFGFSFEPPQQRIYYANHTSHLDTLVIWSLIPRDQRRRVRPAAAADYWWTSRWRRYLAERVLHCVPVVRHRASAAENPLEAVEAALTQGDSLIIFPEGTRGSGDAVQPFRSGLYHLAAKFPEVELVPVYLHNLNRTLPKGEFLPVPIVCTVGFGAGLRLMEGEKRDDFIARAQTALEGLASL